MSNKLRRTLFPTKDESAADIKKMLEMFEIDVTNKGCESCANCRSVYEGKRGLIREECYECVAGLKCDTEHWTIKNCRKWVNICEGKNRFCD